MAQAPRHGPLRQRGGPVNGERPSADTARVYTETHWGRKPEWFFVDPDPLLPKQLSAMGRLLELVYDDGKDGQAWSITFPERGPGAWLSFLPRGSTRLYVQYAPGSDLRADVREAHWTAHPRAPVYRLDEVAHAAGGRQQGGYPAVNVKVLGRILEVYYYTLKGDGDGDGNPESYVHELGTEPDNDFLPWLCVDATGRLWWAGGDYVTRESGICG